MRIPTPFALRAVAALGVAAALLLPLTGCGGGSSGTGRSGSGGLSGTTRVLRGDDILVYAHATLEVWTQPPVRNQPSVLLMNFSSDDNGHFRIDLPPGDYYVSGSGSDPVTGVPIIFADVYTVGNDGLDVELLFKPVAQILGGAPGP